MSLVFLAIIVTISVLSPILGTDTRTPELVGR